MQASNFSNQELSACLEVLYGSKRVFGQSPYGFVCSSIHYNSQNVIQIAGPSSAMRRVVEKANYINTLLKKENPKTNITFFNFLLKKEDSDAGLGFSFYRSGGHIRLILVNAQFADIFKGALFYDLLADETRWNNFYAKVGYKKAAL